LIFKNKDKNKKYCSQQCAKAASKNGKDFTCSYCEKTHYVPGCKLKRNIRNRFCSKECHRSWMKQRRPVRTCVECEKQFKKKCNAKAKYCSNKCKLNGKNNIKQLAEMRRIQAGKETKLEKFCYALMRELCLNFKPQYIFCGRYVADAFLPKSNTLVQFDGDYWHGNPKKYIKLKYKSQQLTWKSDRKSDRLAKKSGYNVLRFWESDIYKNVDFVKNKLQQCEAKYEKDKRRS
jgi:very-short-patch-repair endonuclease